MNKYSNSCFSPTAALQPYLFIHLPLYFSGWIQREVFSESIYGKTASRLGAVMLYRYQWSDKRRVRTMMEVIVRQISLLALLSVLLLHVQAFQSCPSVCTCKWKNGKERTTEINQESPLILCEKYIIQKYFSYQNIVHLIGIHIFK